jgi:hypothetical protein
MLENSIVERTDFSWPKLVTATKSLNRFYDFEVDRLRIEKRLFTEELQKTFEPGKRLELLKVLSENEAEQRKLSEGWENSSLRRRLSPVQGGEQAANPARIEHRLLATSSSQGSLLAEPRAAGPSKQTKLNGYAAIYNEFSLDMGGWKEKIAVGAFDKIVKTCDCRFLLNHNPDLILARTANKTLRLYSDGNGLLFYADLIDGDAVSDAIANRIQRKDISGCSFAFIVGKDRWEFAKEKGQSDTRIILEIAELLDCGPVVYPAYTDTTVSVLSERSSNNKDTNSGGSYSDADFVRDQDIEDDEILQEIRRQHLIEKQEIERKYRKAGYIIARNRYCLQK